MAISHISIIGLGLIGGSLAKALKKVQPSLHISAYNRSEKVIKQALAEHIIDSGSHQPENAVNNADMVIICTPLSTYPAIVADIVPHIKPHTIITDAGSVKQCVIDDLKPLLSGEQRKHFVPAHPIAGSAKTGLDAADATLYHDRRVILTPLNETSEEATGAVAALWQSVGARTEQMSALHHDTVFAAMSHMPQFLAYTYGLLLQNEKVKGVYATDAFTRFLRIGDSSPAMWNDIFFSNQAAIRHWLGKLIDALKTTSASLSADINTFAEDYCSESAAKHNDVHLWRDIMPAILAQSLRSTVTTHVDYAGSGFADFTSIRRIQAQPSDIVAKHAEIVTAIDILLSYIRHEREWLDNPDQLSHWKEAQAAHKTLIG